MIAPANFADEVDCGSFFDHIDDLLDFPTDDIEACFSGAEGNVNSFPSLWTTRSDSLPSSDSVVSHNHSASDLSAELSVPYEDIIQLEWLSNFVEDSFSEGSLTMNKQDPTLINKDSSNQFQMSSPVSVLESSSSCSGDHKTAPQSPETIPSGKRGRPRSKRPRPASFVPRLTMQLMSPTSSINRPRPQHPFVFPKTNLDSENCAESLLLPRHALPEQKKKKKKMFTMPLGQPTEINLDSTATQAQNVRKCTHCEITKTPQWRAGPMGPKTLCNACGVRHKSGRLFPEYRPAASPTFVPSLHSNSHKKVIEMRNKVSENPVMKLTSTGAMRADSPELIPNNSTL